MIPSMRRRRVFRIGMASCLLGSVLAWVLDIPAALAADAGSVGRGWAGRVEVEVEEPLYDHKPADNGAGPMWCSGSTCLVRSGDTVYAAGLETLEGVPPLNNCRWVLWRRGRTGWERWLVDESGRTREPSPLAVFGDGRVWLSANPTLNPRERGGGGPARPELREIREAGSGAAPSVRVVFPGWQGEPRFSEHSYRSLAADGPGSELILLQNIDYGHAEWAFLDAEGKWSAQGRLTWPWGGGYAKPQPIRVCYPNVALQGRAVHFCGVSDILEPNPEWKAFKRGLTGKEWDYDFRRLFYTHTPDITRQPFREWVEVASREATCGWISPADLALLPNGEVWVMWTERALDERLRDKFFPGARQSHALKLARLREGRVLERITMAESTEDHPAPVVGAARFHRDAAGRMWVVRWVAGAGVRGNDLVPLGADGRAGDPIPFQLSRPLVSFFTATPRAGSAAGDLVDLLGVPEGAPTSLAYVRLRLRPER